MLKVAAQHFNPWVAGFDGDCYHRATTLRRTNWSQQNKVAKLDGAIRDLVLGCFQLPRPGTAYEPGGREFQSLRARQIPNAR
jgi:hypothetical protein